MLPVQLFTMRTAKLLPSVLLIRDCNDFIAFLTYKMTNNFRAQFLIFQRKIYDIKANAKRKKQEERYDIIINEVYTMTKSKRKVYRLNDFFL